MPSILTRVSAAACVTAAMLLAGSYAGAAEDSDFVFGLWGDMPYAKNGDGAKNGPKMQAVIADMNAARLAFTIFDGDTKDGSSFCDDTSIGQESIDYFNRLVPATIYVLGDNEWTDCHRTNNGGFNALERLTFLRQHLFNSVNSFGQHKIPLQHQGQPGQPYSENTRWTRGGVIFVGLNVPGSNNNKVNAGQCTSSKSVRTNADCDADNAEYADRNAHNLDWLASSFQRARQTHAKGVMIVIQADPGFDIPETEAVDDRLANLANVDGYNDLLAAIVNESNNFSGQVVLVHGDTHFFKIDKPLNPLVATIPGAMIGNFTRVETFGSPNLDWIRVVVRPFSRSVFTFEPMIVPAN
jgi:hypothetical protein